jgi:hypothetical protein
MVFIKLGVKRERERKRGGILGMSVVKEIWNNFVLETLCIYDIIKKGDFLDKKI